MAFGNVNVGESATRTLTITNSGNAAITFTALTATGGTGTAGFTASPTSGTIAAGSSIQVVVKFSPSAAQGYSHVLTVIGNQTSGNAAINVSGSGVNNNPIYSKAGTGDNVFTLPSYVSRVRIQAVYTQNSSNFIVKVSGSLVVNELLGTGWGQTTFDGTYLVAAGGTVQITNSSGVSWTFTEVR
jgi:hypothetical protein